MKGTMKNATLAYQWQPLNCSNKKLVIENKKESHAITYKICYTIGIRNQLLFPAMLFAVPTIQYFIKI